MTRVLEGTWEEIAAHAAEFNGHRLRVIDLGLIDEAANDRAEGEEAEGRTLAEVFAGRTGRVAFLPNDVAGRSEEYFAQIMDEKYRKDQEKRQASP